MSGPPIEPIVELLSEAVLAVVSQLKSVTTGYNTILTDAVRFTTKPTVNPVDRLAVIYEGHEEKVSDPNTPEQRTAWKKSYDVLVYAFAAEPYTDYAKDVNRIRADIEKIMRQETEKNLPFSGYSYNNECVGADFGADANDLPCIVVMFDIYYRTLQFDPYTLG